MDKKTEAVAVGKTGTPHRESNLELFRILTMLLIIAHHYVVNSGLIQVIYQNPMAPKSLFFFLFGAWGKIGINCFLLITGYFMCKSHISARKFAKLVAEVLFYKILFFCAFLLTGYEPFSLGKLIKTILPVTSIAQNFTGCYLVFFLCIPFLNILIQNLNERQHIRLILLLGTVYIVLGSIPKFQLSMNYVSWYSILYIMASYIRLYPKKIFTNTTFWGWMSAVTLVVSSVSVVFCVWVGSRAGKQMAYFFVADSNKFLAVLTALSWFLFFQNLKLKYSRLINTAAASTFGVLMIHANSDAMRRWLWQDVVDCVGMYDAKWAAVYAVGCVLVIFAVCTALDRLRIRFIEKPLEQRWDKRNA